MAVQIRMVETSDELLAVCRFRYDIYVQEMGLNPNEADHAQGIIRDSLDESGQIFMAIENGQVVGTVRSNLASCTNFGPDVDRFEMEQFGRFFPNRVGMTTRLMVSSRYRSGILGTRLAKTWFEFAYTNGMRFDNICCHARQLPFMHRMGYRQVLPSFFLEGFGESHRLVLALADREHLLRVGSPFASLLPEVPEDFGSVDFFYENILHQQHAYAA
jgi:hypothetical protein